MEQVHIIARAVALDNKIDALREALRGMLTPTHAEPGCQRYDLYESNTPGRFYFYETWESCEALDQHIASSHFKELQTKLGGLLQGELEVNTLRMVS
jgi:quinol monooxygenase YgiN